jgi:hypothetical protein
MDSRFNIPAPAVVKLEKDMCEEKSRRLKVAVPQGDGEASAEPDSLNHASRKSLKCSHGRPYRKPTQVGE